MNKIVYTETPTQEVMNIIKEKYDGFPFSRDDLGYYTLDKDKNVIPCPAYIPFLFHGTKEYSVGKEILENGYFVSTVFLGRNHALFTDEIIIFETMIMKPNGDFLDYQTRCKTWEQALKMHEDGIKYAMDLKEELTHEITQ